MLATDLDPMMRAKGKHARTHAIMACLTNMPLRLPLVCASFEPCLGSLLIPVSKILNKEGREKKGKNKGGI